jgi:hypothetical protein
MRLGLDACEKVLDRLLGKPKSVSEVRNMDVFSEIKQLDDDWTVEGVEEAVIED